jgi:DcuC family C4-dicarboxylate transporter
MILLAETAVPAAWQQLLGLVVIAFAVWAIVREVEVRIVMVCSALALGVLAWNPEAIVRVFLVTFTNERFIIPLCCGMGFAHVLKHTGCDQHLVHLLVDPLSKVRALLVPGTVVVGFLVNMPIVSQSSTAVAIGAVIIPVLRGAGVSPVTIGAALLLGCSIGGELLNPGAPELQTTVTVSQRMVREINQRSEAAWYASLIGQSVLSVDAALASANPERAALATPYDPLAFNHERCVRRIFPLNLLGLFIATGVFWVQSLRYERTQNASAGPTVAHFQVNWVKAAVPLLPIAFLYLSSYPFNWLELPRAWIVAGDQPSPLMGTRLIGFAMLLGVVAAAAVTPSKVPGLATAFFEGAGFGFAHIVSLIVVANCFGEGITQIGIAATIGQFIQAWPESLYPSAGILCLGFAALCGSGMATAQSLFGFFADPALKLGVDPTHVGAVVSLASAAGRTMSPVAAVTLMCARMTDTKPLELAKYVALPLVISVAIIVVVAMITSPAL